MKHRFTVYDAASGRILRAGECSRAGDVAHQARAGEAVLNRAADVAADYVDSGRLARRPALAVRPTVIPADGEPVAVARSLPAGTAVAVAAGVAALASHAGIVGEDGLLEVSATEPGILTVKLDPPFPWLPATITVTAR